MVCIGAENRATNREGIVSVALGRRIVDDISAELRAVASESGNTLILKQLGTDQNSQIALSHSGYSNEAHGN